MSAKTTGFPTFAQFFRATHDGLEPHPWQQSLSDRVCDSGWPNSISVPTGLGKTATISVWLYELARQTAAEVPQRSAPMRLFYVVNRRLVVDQGAAYAKGLQKALDQVDVDSDMRDVLDPVRQALLTLCPPGDTRPLLSTSIHGTDPDDTAWMRATGAVIVSLTPAQLVSRVLMRGYGVSAGTRSIHAGLTGIDRLILFDEPHLSMPAVNTLAAQERLAARGESLGIPLGKTVLLGATVPDLDEGTVGARALKFDVDEHLSSPAASRRLRAPKTLHIERLATTSDVALANAAAKFVQAQVTQGVERILVVLNTVAAAQRVFLKLQQVAERKSAPVNVALLTSRFRRSDRASVGLNEGPLILVATQTIEVGVDLSFDAMFTEVPSFESLTQRLGRVNRDGLAAESHVVLAAQKGASGNGSFRVSKSTAHIYGEGPVLACLDLLERHRDPDGDVDVSPVALMRMRDSVTDGSLDVAPERAATLHSHLMPIIAQTRPTPRPDLPVEAFANGPDQNVVPEVEVAWRPNLKALLGLRKSEVPSPLDSEYVSVPYGQIRKLLLGRATSADFSDITGVPEQDAPGRRLGPRVLNRVCVLNPGDDQWHQVGAAGQVRPGARVVLACEVGGYVPSLGWRPESTESVPSVQFASLQMALAQDARQLEFRSPPTHLLAVSPRLLAEISPDDARYLPTERLLESATQYWLREPDLSRAQEEQLVAELVEAANDLVAVLAEGNGAVLGPEIAGNVNAWGVSLPVALTRKATSRGGVGQVLLADHGRQVGLWARGAAQTAGLPEGISEALANAGFFRDEGKRFLPFQQYLGAVEGDPGGPLAKSKIARRDQTMRGSRASDRAVRQRLGLPWGWRHEQYGLAFIPLGLRERPLVDHLVGSHHGWYRPVFLPSAGDSVGPATQDDAFKVLGVEHADEFLALNQRFSPWGLAYLEAVLRLADWTASATPLATSGLDALVEPSSSEVEVVVIPPPHQVPRAHDAEAEPANEHRLEGLRVYPMASWYVAAGLLAAATEMGDSVATVEWRNESHLPAVAPLLPVLRTRFALEELVHYVHSSPWWERTDAALLDHGCKSYWIKGQKMGPADRLGSVLREGDEEGNSVLLGSVTDARAADDKTKQIPLAIPAFANNTSYPSMVRDIIAVGVDGEVRALEALGDSSAGFVVSARDGGFERGEEFEPLTNGREGSSARLQRGVLNVLGLYGMTALGTVPPRGLASWGRELILPLPEEPQTLAELRALVLIGLRRPRANWASIGCEWVLRGEQVGRGRMEMSSWSVRPVLRSELEGKRRGS